MQQPQDPSGDKKVYETHETVYVSSIALMKMLKHGKSGVPVEVMGALLGRIVDEYTIQVVDVFSFPQSGTSKYVESIDEAYQPQMMELLAQTGRTEMMVGWYHSHPGYGCFLSSIDVDMASKFETLNPRSISIVVDPIRSMKGKIVIDCFRTYSAGSQAGGMGMMFGMGQGHYRQQTSNVGHLSGNGMLDRHRNMANQYYQLPMEFSKTEMDEKMLLVLEKRKWTDSLDNKTLKRKEQNEKSIDDMISLVKQYNKDIKEESMNPKERVLQEVGKIDSKKRLKEKANEVTSDNMVDSLGVFMNSVIF